MSFFTRLRLLGISGLGVGFQGPASEESPVPAKLCTAKVMILFKGKGYGYGKFRSCESVRSSMRAASSPT